VFFSQNKVELMIHWLTRSAENNNLLAIEALASIYAKGGFIDADLLRAKDLYNKGVKLGSTEAIFQLAEIEFVNSENDCVIADGLRLYWEAAELKHPDSLFTLYLLYRRNIKFEKFSLYCLSLACIQGFLPAIHSLGIELLKFQQNSNLAEFLLKSSKEMGYPNSKNCPKFIPKVIESVSDDLKQLTSGFNRNMLIPIFEAIEINESNFQLHLVSKKINLNVCDNFISKVEALFIIFLSVSYQQKARVVHSDRRKGSMDSDVRTNHAMYFSPSRVTGFIRHIERKISNFVAMPVNRSEPLSVLMYTRGQEYKPHFDYFDPSLKITSELLKKGGQRCRTVLLYLNDVVEGGETHFPSINELISANQGTVVYMDNCLNGGKINPLSLHAGMPVKNGEKWIAVSWFREDVFRIY